MDNRLLIGFGGFLAVFLLFPIVSQMMRADKGGDKDTTVQSGGSAGAEKTGRAKIPNDPPLLNAQNLVGSEWQVVWENYKIKVTIAANGVCYATHPLMKSVTNMDYFEGRWSINYDRVIVEARFGDQYFNQELIVSGNDLYSPDGMKIERFM